MNKLPARTGVDWLKQGFNLFRQQPFLLTTLLFLQLIFVLLLANVPVIGQVAPLVLLPSFAMSIQMACHLIDEGRPLNITVALTGFRKDVVRPLLKLGVVYLIVILGISLAMTPFVDLAALEQFSKTMKAAGGKPPATIDPAVMSALTTQMIMALLLTIAMVLLSFAPALVYWKKMPTFKAIFYSVFAVFGAAGPVLALLATVTGISLLLFSVIAIVLGATPIVSLALLWFSLIVSLIVQCAMYMAYKQIMGAPEPEPALK